MKSKIITEEEISPLKISSLPTRPTAPSSFGGRGYTSAEMKAAFDRLPLFIIERFNALIADIEAVGEGSLASSIMTGFAQGHSLCDLFSEIKSGEILSTIPTGDGSLASELAVIKERLSRLEERSNNINE